MLVPFVTDLIETGAWPDSPRALITEVVLAIVIWSLVHHVCRDILEMARMARVDALTGLWNRRAFLEVLQDECVRSTRSGESLTLVYLDLDEFKKVNDRWGHAAGDQLLQHIASVLQGTVRAHVDRCFRLGGDEFAVLLPTATVVETRRVLVRVRDRTRLPGAPWDVAGIGVSCGIVEHAAGEDADAFVRRADREMYRQKAGRTPRTHMTL
jgi:diguanylate cyclase